MTADEGSDVRRRPVANTDTASSSTPSSASVNRKVKAADEPLITVFDILRVLGGIALASTVFSYLYTGGSSYTWNAKRPWWTQPAAIQRWRDGPLQLTNEQLAAYDGSDPSKPILLAINRTIYDVSSSPQVYGIGGMYATLAAKDASRSYITTCFDPVDDLVPYLGGVEEVYVPLWLSRAAVQDEMDEIASGEVMQGISVGGMLDKIKQRVGRKKMRKLQDEAYAKARERVAAQIQSWESMFEKKAYPIVGKVVGVDESDPKKWKSLKFCEKARKQRPSMADTFGEALKAVTGSDKVDIGKMKANMASGARAAGLNTGDKIKKSAKKAKKAAKESVEGSADEGAAEEDVAAAAVAGDKSKKTKDDMKGNADASIEDMMKGGKYNSESKERSEKIAKEKKKQQQDKANKEL